MLLRFYPCVGIWRFYVLMHLEFMTCLLGDVCYISVAWLFEFLCMLYSGELLET